MDHDDGQLTLMRYEESETIHRFGVMDDEVPALQHRLVVGEDTVELHETLD